MRFLLSIAVVFLAALPIAAAEQGGNSESATVTCRVLDQESGTVSEQEMRLSHPGTVEACKQGKIAFIEFHVEKGAGADPAPNPAWQKAKGEEPSAD